ncbi:MAG TPA: DUF2500 family protein [Kofleriaceae bacterium]|nr:DUF2500 family protein [Kofleriaceae bacterium]
MTCPQCGAAIRADDGRFCSHCGASLPDRPRITADEWPTHPERFDQAKRDPSYERALALDPPAPKLWQTILPVAVFSIFWIGIGGAVVAGFAKGGGAMVLFPIFILGFGLVMMGVTVRTAVTKARAPVMRQLAVVVDERTEIHTTGSGDSRSTHTRYFATLQFKDGDRLECGTSGALSGAIAKGDIGLAVLRGGDLVDFHRIRV